MICDPEIECVCDECGDSIYVSPSYVYHDYSGNNGYYDTSDSSIEKKLVSEGWTCEGGKHFCDDCRGGVK